MFSPHPEVIIEQVGVDGGLQVEGGRDKTLSSDLGLAGVAVKWCSSLGNIVSARNTEFGTLLWHPGIRVKFGTNKQNWDFLGPFQDFGSYWEKVPNLGLRWEHCSAEHIYSVEVLKMGHRIYISFFDGTIDHISRHTAHSSIINCSDPLFYN